MTHNLRILEKKNIKLQQASTSKPQAIKDSGQLLVDSGYVDAKYIDSMILRDENLSVYMGSYLAIPHGEFEAKDLIHHSGMSVLIYPEGIDWDGNTVKIVIGLAGLGDDHMEIISNVATIFSEEENIQKIIEATDIESVYKLFTES